MTSSAAIMHSHQGFSALGDEVPASVSAAPGTANVGDYSRGKVDTSSPPMVSTFLTLLVAEIQNQDPTDPTSATEYITQISSMAQVAISEEMLVQMNINSILMSNMQVIALGKLVGEPIMVQTSSLNIGDGVIRGRITLDDACTTVDIHLTDDAGNDYDIPLGPQSPGQVSFDIDPADYGIPPGEYQISVVTNTGEQEIPIEVQGVVNDVRIPLDGSTPMLNITGVGEVPFTMISQFGISDTPPVEA